MNKPTLGNVVYYSRNTLRELQGVALDHGCMDFLAAAIVVGSDGSAYLDANGTRINLKPSLPRGQADTRRTT